MEMVLEPQEIINNNVEKFSMLLLCFEQKEKKILTKNREKLYILLEEETTKNVNKKIRKLTVGI